MLIGCRFKRPKAPIELPGKTYFFVPIDPTNPDSEHVAEVEDNAHIQRLLSIPEGYYISEAQVIPTAARPTAQQPVDPASTGTQDDDSTNTAPVGSNETLALPPELEEAAKNLNGLTWQALQAQLKKGGLDKAVVQRALDIELAKPDEDQRGTTVKLLKAELGIQ